MFGREPPDAETQSEDEDWGPKMRKRRRVGTSIDICMTNSVTEDACSHLGPINRLSSDKKRQIFRIPPEAVEVISIAFWKIFYYLFCSFASLDLFVAVGKKYYYTNIIVISIENLRIISSVIAVMRWTMHSNIIDNKMQINIDLCCEGRLFLEICSYSNSWRSTDEDVWYWCYMSRDKRFYREI